MISHEVSHACAKLSLLACAPANYECTEQNQLYTDSSTVELASSSKSLLNATRCKKVVKQPTFYARAGEKWMSRRWSLPSRKSLTNFASLNRPSTDSSVLDKYEHSKLVNSPAYVGVLLSSSGKEPNESNTRNQRGSSDQAR